MLFYGHILLVCCLALLLDAIIGDPKRLWSRIPHPVVIIGKFIGLGDKLLNWNKAGPRTRKVMGVFFLLLLVALAASIGVLIQYGLEKVPYGWIGTGIIASIFLAQNSLYRHVAAVRNALRDEGLDGGRKAVSMIVGRDTKALDEAGISRAAIESCAENYSDGVVAPLFWLLVAGLPGLITYKAINTADSMIGHKTPRHQSFGWASARLDDLVNLPASRIAGFLVAISAVLVPANPAKAIEGMFKDADLHRSPNAGWPEAAMAYALGLSLAGPRQYEGYHVDDTYMNVHGRREATYEDITRALRMLFGVCVLQFIPIAIVTAFVYRSAFDAVSIF
ncbi:cobalamin biosynthesis protein [Rhodobacteraceae bacterium RKSG542]|uniref:adenosylcobinamide-phosphate synthase CbiB n=1 Tax=Pseudovibrio flavus TaxID=2529854 RepID=UPI0012BD4FCF|nr:adenosylcobinamide-phosphate synthase CbiB [Pseudovibrio flavus]MTI17310.1 cobalamin biosynthesis protein [Pseudovibrio flavus]